MFTERQKKIIHLALSYIRANMSEVNEFFAPIDYSAPACSLDYNGEPMDLIRDKELGEIHVLLQQDK